MQFKSFLLGEIVAVTFAPLPVALRKGAPAETGDAVHVPEGIHEIDPLLAAVRSHRAVKVTVYTGIALLQQGYQVVVQRGSGLARQLELPVQRLEIITNRIHGSILQQNLPLVKSGLGDFQSVGPVGLHFADVDALPVVFDDQRVHGGDEEAGAVHAHGKGFVIPARVLHDDPSFAVQSAQLLY